MEAGYPFVFHGRTEIPGHAWFDFDNEEFARHAVRAMAQAGRRKIAVIMPPPQFMFERFILAGVEDEARKLKIELDLCEGISLDTPADELEAYLKNRFVSSGKWCDGIVCPGETSAIVAAAVVSDQGMTPQSDILIIAKQTTYLFEN